MLTAEEMIEEQRANCDNYAMLIVDGTFMPELELAAKEPDLRSIVVEFNEKSISVVKRVWDVLENMKYTVVRMPFKPEEPDLWRFKVSWAEVSQAGDASPR